MEQSLAVVQRGAGEGEWGGVLSPTSPVTPGSCPSSEQLQLCDTHTTPAEETQAVSGLYTLTAGMFSF